MALLKVKSPKHQQHIEMAIRLENISIKVDSKILVKNLSCQFNSGEFWGIVGPNGVGKTTLLYSICNIHPICQGAIYLNDRELSHYSDAERAKNIALMQQNYENNFPSTVYDAIKLARLPYLFNSEYDFTEEKRIIAEVIEKTQLNDFLKREVNTLSGGEKRLVHLAMLLAQNVQNQLLDEPTNHLDLAHMGLLMKILSMEQKKQKTNLLVTHDINMVSQFCTHVLLLFPDANWIAGEVEQMLTQENISRLYQLPIKHTFYNGKRYFLPDWG